MQHPEIIANNPLRILGVYVGDSMAKEANNVSRIVAYDKVGKTAEFTMRGDDQLPPLQRTEKMAIEAQQQLTLPNDRLRYALFWYGTPENIELNNAIDAMIEKQQSDAFSHYIAMINDEQQYRTFIQAATHGLLFPAKDTLLSMLLHTLEEIGEMPLLLQNPVGSFSLLRPEVESTSIFLNGIQSGYGFDSPRYSDYLQKAVVNLCNSGKYIDRSFKNTDFISLVQLDLHLEVCEVAHKYIIDTVNSWMAKSNAMILASLMAPYRQSHFEILSLVSAKKEKIKRNKTKENVRTVIWLLIVSFFTFLFMAIK